MIQEKADFNFFVPIDFEKATTKKGEKIMKIKGIASTNDQDSEGEILEPVGFDLSRFLSIGYLNYNHGSKNDVSKIVGEPTVAKITPKGDLYVEGVLYNGHPLAEGIWNMAETLQRNGSKRRIGFSIEGRALTRDIANPKRITSALLTGLAITPTPVNGSTYMELCKGIQSEDYVDYEYDKSTVIEKAEKESKYLYEFENGGKRYGITKSFAVEEIEKTMDVAATQPLVPESLDGKKKVLDPVIKKAISEGILSFENIVDICKSKSGVYKNTKENQKLGRVGQKYGEKKQEDDNFLDNITFESDYFEPNDKVDFSQGKPELEVKNENPENTVNARLHIEVRFPIVGKYKESGEEVKMRGVTAQIIGRYDKEKKILELTKIDVSKEIRRKGVASYLVQLALKEAHKGYTVQTSGVFSDQGKGLSQNLIRRDILKKAVIEGVVSVETVMDICKGRGKKAEIGEIREVIGQKYQKQADKTWKKVGEPDPNYKHPEPKKTWISEMPYRDYERLSTSMRKLTGEEAQVLLDKKKKTRDSAYTGSLDKARLRDDIQELQKIVDAHSKLQG